MCSGISISKPGGLLFVATFSFKISLLLHANCRTTASFHDHTQEHCYDELIARGIIFFILQSMVFKGGMGSDRYLKTPEIKRGDEPTVTAIQHPNEMDTAFANQLSKNTS